MAEKQFNVGKEIAGLIIRGGLIGLFLLIVGVGIIINLLTPFLIEYIPQSQIEIIEDIVAELRCIKSSSL